LREGLPFVVLHHNEEAPVFRLFDPMDDADIGMVQNGRRARFAKQTLPLVFTEGHPVRQELQRDGALQGQVQRLVYDPHPAGAELLGDAVVRDA
jgi:hypothetical protein